MVLRLADQLDVPLRERNALLLAAGFAPRYTERPLDDDALSAARTAVERVLRAHEPYPALAFDRRWNIVMTNRAVEPFFADVDPELLRPPVNLVRLGLDPRGFAPLVVNLADVRAVFRSRITRQLALTHDAGLAALHERIAGDGLRRRVGPVRRVRRPDPDDPSSRRTGGTAVLDHHHVRHSHGHHPGRGGGRVVLPRGRRERRVLRGTTARRLRSADRMVPVRSGPMPSAAQRPRPRAPARSRRSERPPSRCGRLPATGAGRGRVPQGTRPPLRRPALERRSRVPAPVGVEAGLLLAVPAGVHVAPPAGAAAAGVEEGGSAGR